MKLALEIPFSRRSLALLLTLVLAVPTLQAADADPTELPEGHEPATPASLEEQEEQDLELESDPQKRLPLEDLRKFTEVFDRIKRAYVEEVSDQALLDKAIEGMLSGLDPHSSYLKPQAFNQLEESTSGEFGGLGIEVGMEKGFVQVIAPIDDTPAARAGIQPGDLIIRIDDQSVKGMSLEDAVKKMRGEPGSEVTLTLSREGESGPVEVTLERAIIQVTSVRTEMLEKGYGYVRISHFQQNTGRDFKAALESLEKENGDTLNGLVLDLRNNPGGVLQAAVDVADALLDEGKIVYTEGRIADSQLEFNASPGDSASGVPVVVLINAGSASASEIVAGALQDHGRAVILGTDSFGKGSVQTVMPLGTDYAIKLTTALYFTPDGRSIQAKGIKPDIRVQQARIENLESGRTISESDLTGHLGNGSGEDGPEEGQEQEEEKPSVSERLARDYQLRTAVNLLQGMSIFDQRRNRNLQQPELD
ncbi:MAG: S41 family peptidase [Oleiphilaceae bacterium]|nr:S41 family peptidase [Oleiphilaceae bacterium]